MNVEPNVQNQLSTGERERLVINVNASFGMTALRKFGGGRHV
jgi:hypothetical protein